MQKDYHKGPFWHSILCSRLSKALVLFVWDNRHATLFGEGGGVQSNVCLSSKMEILPVAVGCSCINTSVIILFNSSYILA